MEKVEKQVRTQAERPQRAKRVKFNSFSYKLDVPMEIEGYKLHWFNDVDTRIIRAQQGGWEFVSPKEVGMMSEDSQVKRVVGKSDDGPITAFLMKIRQEWWDEDRAEESAHNRQFEEAIKRQRPLDGAGVTNSYIPSTGMSLTRD